MITFFKANDPYRLVAAFVILVIIRLIIVFTGSQEILPELKWQLIGEKLGNGSIMYRDLWDYTSPLAAFVYKWLYIFFGKSRIPYFIVSAGLVIYQAGIFNNVLLQNKAYNQNTYVPALIYVLLMNSFFDFVTLPPVLMSMTFVLLAINNVFKRMDNMTKDSLFVYTGIYLGVAALFYLPAVLFFIVTLISLLIYTGSILRRLLLLIYGFGIVLILASMFYYWHGAERQFHSFFYGSLFDLSTYQYVSKSNMWWASLIPILILIFSVFKMLQDGRFINFQERIQFVMFFYLLSGFLAMLLINEASTFQLIYFVPFVAFFVTHYLLTIRNWIAAEASAIVIFILLFANQGIAENGFLFFQPYLSYQEILTQGSGSEFSKGKKILVLGEDVNRYKDAELATPFLNWQISSRVLENPNYYDNLSIIHDEFEKDLPEVLVDDQDIMTPIFDRIPWIEERYEVASYNPKMYFRKD